MKKIWHIGFNDIRLMVRDRTFFFWTLVFPLMFILLFGSVIRGDRTAAVASLKVLNRDTGPWGAYFIEKLKAPGINLEVVEKEPGEYNRVLIIPEDFSKKIAGKEAQQLVFKKKSGASVEAAAQVETKIIQAIAKTLTELILHPDSDTYVEEFLYDLEADPHERYNLVADPSLAGVRDELAHTLTRRMVEAGEEAPEVRPAKS